MPPLVGPTWPILTTMSCADATPANTTQRPRRRRFSLICMQIPPVEMGFGGTSPEARHDTRNGGLVRGFMTVGSPPLNGGVRSPRRVDVAISWATAGRPRPQGRDNSRARRGRSNRSHGPRSASAPRACGTRARVDLRCRSTRMRSYFAMLRQGARRAAAHCEGGGARRARSAARVRLAARPPAAASRGRAAGHPVTAGGSSRPAAGRSARSPRSGSAIAAGAHGSGGGPGRRRRPPGVGCRTGVRGHSTTSVSVGTLSGGPPARGVIRRPRGCAIA